MDTDTVMAEERWLSTAARARLHGLFWGGFVLVGEFHCCCLILVPVVAPSDVSGGGGNSRELTITWTVCVDFPQDMRRGKGVIRSLRSTQNVNIQC